jgi:transcriptional regulator with XRE-family HTH domain
MKQPIPKPISRLLAERKRSGLKLAEVGAAVKLDPSTLTRYERGLRLAEKHARLLERFYGAKIGSLTDKTILVVKDAR